MRTTRLVAAFAGLLALAVCAADASAMYNPSTGTWLQRDPGPGGMMAAAPRLGRGPAMGGGFMPRDQYSDGMNLYQYCRAAPLALGDPEGLAVPGKMIYDTRTVHATDAAWKAARAQSNVAGQTQFLTSASVSATFNPAAPCDCTFTINSLDIGIAIDIPAVGVTWYEPSWFGTGAPPVKMSGSLFGTNSMHEAFHRTEFIATWTRYIGQLTTTRTCKYTRGAWISNRPAPRSAQSCAESGKILQDYLEGQLDDHLIAVAKQFDSGVSPYAYASTLTAADATATAMITSMSMRDWDCGDTHRWFTPW
jgi:hypothetical protein